MGNKYGRSPFRWGKCRVWGNGSACIHEYEHTQGVFYLDFLGIQETCESLEEAKSYKKGNWVEITTIEDE